MDKETINFFKNMLEFDKEDRHKKKLNEKSFYKYVNKLMEFLPDNKAPMNLIYLNNKNLIENEDLNYVNELNSRIYKNNKLLPYSILILFGNIKLFHSLNYTYSIGFMNSLKITIFLLTGSYFFFLKYLLIDNKKNLFLNQKYLSKIETFMITGNILDINKDFDLINRENEYKSTKELKQAINSILNENI